VSYTIVVDEAERERRLENVINVVSRRCRIGKVTPINRRPAKSLADYLFDYQKTIKWPPMMNGTAADNLVPAHGVML
jgi:hypothetical protein